MSSQFAAAYVLKPTIAGLTATLLNRYVLDERNMVRNMTFGASAAVSIALASMTEPTFEKAFDGDGSSFKIGKSFSGRVFEIVAGSGGAFLANRFIANNDPFEQTPIKLIAIVAFSDILGETVLQMTKMA